VICCEQNGWWHGVAASYAPTMAELRLVPEPSPRRAPAEAEPLWREALGRRLRALRLERGEKLTDTASRAGVSPQYLSEVERGRKDPSSEMIAAMAGALDVMLIDLAEQVAADLRFARAFVGRRPVPMPVRTRSAPAQPRALLSLAA
jgi:DNA-binding XRE family transcriptional regulator